MVQEEDEGLEECGIEELYPLPPVAEKVAPAPMRPGGPYEIGEFITRKRATGFKIQISETVKGGKWEFLGSIPTDLVEPGTSRSILFNSREEAVLAAKNAGYEEGKIYSKETGKEVAIPKAEEVK